jgi:glycine/D-amino acid oxidase-like deaminating enzyme
MEMWETEAPYCNFYHRTSWIQVIKEGSHRSTMKGPKDKAVSIEEMLEMVGSHDKPRLDPGEGLWLNEDIGYVDSALAVEAVAKEASSLGVVREKKDVTRLIVNDGICQGAEVGGDITEGYRELFPKTILALPSHLCPSLQLPQLSTYLLDTDET